jgi:hypothetical protein
MHTCTASVPTDSVQSEGAMHYTNMQMCLVPHTDST